MRNFENCVIRRAEQVRSGDTVKFELSSANYRVDSIERTEIGMVRHRHGCGTGSSSYWPEELLYVETAR